MPRTSMNPFARLVDNATVAVDAYIDRVLPGRPTEARAEDRSSPDTLHSLLNDLLHFCDHHGIDFDEVLEAARISHSEDLALEQTFTYGDEVQPRHAATWRGIVVGVHTTHRYEVLHTVRIPGEREKVVMPVEDLKTATPIGPIDSPGGPLTTAQEVEQRLEELSLLIRRAEHEGHPADPGLYAEQDDLINALADWSGGSGTVILQLLGPKIATAVEAERSQAAPSDLAGAAFPEDIADGLKQAPPSPRPPAAGRGTPPSDGHRRSR